MLQTQVVETMVQSVGGRKILAAAQDNQSLHLTCAAEYQAQHGGNVDVRSAAQRVLTELQSIVL